MEQGEEMNELDDPTLLRRYLLGTLDDDVVRTRIEERLMVEEEFIAQLGVVEDELIEEFLDDEMSFEDSKTFNRFFLASPERKRHLRLTRNLRSVSRRDRITSPIPEPVRPANFLSLGWLRFAIAGAALVFVLFGIWRVAIHKSDTDRGLEQLQAAYRDRRPTESRISGLSSYAPYSQTRGADSRVTDPAALDRANRYLIDATVDSNDAAAHHALALYHLAAGDLDKAKREMEIALAGAPGNARIQNDAGAMYFELAGRARERDQAQQIIHLDQALTHFGLALSSDPKLLEAYFNRALALKELGNTGDARKAWQEYLDMDPNSKWSEEARKNLQELTANVPQELSAEALETKFLGAFRSGSESQASTLISANRELITDKYLPFRLAMRVLAAPEGEKEELLRALEFTGEMEMKQGDSFAKEIAHFYRTKSKGASRELLKGHLEFREGFSLCLAPNFEEALQKFESARREFESGGDIFSSKIAGYAIGYALRNLQRTNDASVQFDLVERWARERGFVWLRVTAMHWLAGYELDAKRLSAARRLYEEAIAIADRINDGYVRQRNLSQLGYLYSISGQNNRALRHLFTAVKDSDQRETILRQRYRNLFLLLPALLRARLYNVAIYAAIEVVNSADHQKDAMWVAQSRAFAAIASAAAGDSDFAEQLLTESREKAAEIKTKGDRERVVAFTNLRSADFERSRGNFDTAEAFYIQALRSYANADSILRLEVEQGLLLTYIAAGKTSSIEHQLDQTIRITEQYRSKIQDEDQKIGFFDLNSDVYSIAAEFHFDKKNFEVAYNFAEKSSSRALLNSMQQSAPLEEDLANELTSSGTPLDLNAIRQSLPLGVRLVQYSVFGKKTVIWILSRDSFDVVSVDVEARELRGLVSRFAKAVSTQSSADEPETKELSRDLYRLLIQPFISGLKSDEELCIVPNGMLVDLPFSALSDAEGKPLIARYRIVTAPSSNVFISATKNAATRNNDREESVLAVGNATFEKGRYPELDPLPDSESEAIRISRLYSPNDPLLRHEATKKAFRNAIASSDVVHVAGHYVAFPDAPMSSFLLMASDGGDPAKGELSNLEMAQMKLVRTRLMVLAACRSGVEGFTPSEGMVGMARTLLGIRVPLVVSSQWNVDSAATSALMVRLHEFRKSEKLPTTEALRRAQLELFNDPSGKFSSPYYWAAFAVYGGHADF